MNEEKMIGTKDPQTIAVKEIPGITGQVTAYNVPGARLTSAPKDFYETMLNASHEAFMENKPQNGLTPNTLEDWLEVAYVLHKSRNRHSGATCYNARVDGMRRSVLSGYTSNNVDNGYGWHLYRSGLRHSTSLKNANTDICNFLYDCYCKEKSAHSNIYKKRMHLRPDYMLLTAGNATNDFKGLTNHAEKNKAQNVFWGLVSMNRWTNTSSHKPRSGHGSALAAVFYDFKVIPVLPSDSGDTFVITKNSNEEVAPLNGSNVVNDTPTTVTHQHVSTTTSTVTQTSTMNGSNTYEMGTSVAVAVGAEASGMGVKASVNVTTTLSFKSVIAHGWSNAKGLTETNTTTNTTTITVPPYSAVLQKKSNTTLTEVTEYNCPMMLSYKVMLLDHILNPSNDEANADTSTLGIFGNDTMTAREDLKYHILDEANYKDEAHNIRWDAMYQDNLTKASMNYILNHTAALTPMARTGARYSVDVNTVSTTFDAMISTKPLCRVIAVNTPTKMTMAVGDTFCVDDIVLEGVNAWGYPYVGFTKERGRWHLTYSDGKDYRSGRIASLHKLNSGKTTLFAKDGGKVFLQYAINEDCYNTYANPTVFMTNQSLVSFPVIEITVTGEAQNQSKTGGKTLGMDNLANAIN